MVSKAGSSETLEASKLSLTMATAVSQKGPFYVRMTRKLEAALKPSRLLLRDESHLHAGHRESPGLPETHFALEVVSDEFKGLSLLQRQRKVYGLLQEELKERVHALSMKTRTVAEDVKVETAASAPRT